MEELTASILRHGLLTPLVGVSSGSKIRVLSGARRVAALRRIESLPDVQIPKGFAERGEQGQVRVNVWVWNGLDEKTALLRYFVENETRDDLGSYEQARIYETLALFFERSIERIADAVDRDRSDVSESLRILRSLSKDAVRAWEMGRLSTTHVRLLSRVEDEDDRERLLGRVLREDLSADRLDFLIEGMRDPEALSPEERSLYDLRERLVTDEWVNLRLQAGEIRIEESRKGDRIRVDYASKEELREIVQALERLLRE